MPLKKNPRIRALIAHLTEAPHLTGQLRTLHDLALYESGEALLGAEEKDALFQASRLSKLLDALKPKDLKSLREAL